MLRSRALLLLQQSPASLRNNAFRDFRPRHDSPSFLTLPSWRRRWSGMESQDPSLLSGHRWLSTSIPPPPPPTTGWRGTHEAEDSKSSELSEEERMDHRPQTPPGEGFLFSEEVHPRLSQPQENPPERRKTKRSRYTHPLVEAAESPDWPFSKTERWKVVLVGRPNVGKSTLFNRLAVTPLIGAATASRRNPGTRSGGPGKKRASIHRLRAKEPWRLQGHGRAITHQSPGVTRDRRESPAELSYLRFTLTDTAGLEEVHTYLTTADLHDTQLVGGGAQDEELQEAILYQTERAIAEADIVLFMVDARTGITPVDTYFARWLRSRRKHHAAALAALDTEFRGTAAKGGGGGGGGGGDGAEEKVTMTPVILLGNKVEYFDDPEIQANLQEAMKLGFGAPVTLSAETGDGLAALFEAMYEQMQVLWPRKQLEEARRAEEQRLEAAGSGGETPPEVKELDLVIAGKPNVGKSTLLNALLGEDRVVTGSQPGITRDAVRVRFQHPEFPGYSFNLIDTAGLKGVTAQRHNRYSLVDALAMGDTMRAIAFAHVIVVVIDVSQPSAAGESSRFRIPEGRRIRMEDIPRLIERVRGMITKTDLEILNHVLREGRSMVLVANKWDTIPEPHREATLIGLQGLLEGVASQSKGVPIIPMSAREQVSVEKLLPTVVTSFELWNRRLGTGALNRWLKELLRYRPHPKVRGRPVKLKYMSQINIRPPTFAIFCNRPADVDPKYRRFLLNALREEFELFGQPVRLLFRASANPYVEKKGSTRTASGGLFVESSMRGMGDIETGADETGAIYDSHAPSSGMEAEEEL